MDAWYTKSDPLYRAVPPIEKTPRVWGWVWRGGGGVGPESNGERGSALLAGPGLTMGFDVLSRESGQATVKAADAAQIGQSDFWKKGKDPAEGGVWIANESKTNAVAMGPTPVPGEFCDHLRRNVFAGQDFEQVNFGQVRVFKRSTNDLLIGAHEEGGRGASCTALGKRNPFATRHASDFLEDCLLSNGPDVRRDGRSLRHSQAVEEIKELQDGQ